MNKDREQPIIVVRRKKRGHGGHHGGAWKVAFADFMTSMMALFLVLWLITQSSDVKSAIAGYFKDPLGRANEFGSSIIPGEGAPAASPRPIPQPQITDIRREQLRVLGDRIRQRLRQSIDFRHMADQIEIELTSEGLRIQLVEDSTGTFFRTGSAQPLAGGAALLATLGAELAAMPNQVVVDGYTDAVPYSLSATYTNWELSADRANMARKIMVAGGLPERQVVQVRGHADRSLRVPEDPTSPRNRRVSITMLFADETEAMADSTASAPGAPVDSAMALAPRER